MILTKLIDHSPISKYVNFRVAPVWDMERETSGSPQNDSPAAKVPGAAPGGPVRLDASQPTTSRDSSKRNALELLLAVIRKKPNQPNPSPPRE